MKLAKYKPGSVKPENPESGLIYHWTSPVLVNTPPVNEHLYISIGKGILKVIAVNNISDLTYLDFEFNWSNLGTYELIEKRDLPLYVNFYTGKTFKRLICGEKEIKV